MSRLEKEIKKEKAHIMKTSDKVFYSQCVIVVMAQILLGVILYFIV